MFVQDPQKREEISLYRALMGALLFTILAHALGLLTMATVLRPGVADDYTAYQRAQYIADNATLWRLGWLPWNLSAAGNLAFGVLLLSWLGSLPRRRGRIMAALALLFTVIAVIPDQYGELLMDTELVETARAVTTLAKGPHDPILNLFAGRQTELLTMLGYDANTAYVVMSFFWIIALFRACPPSRARRAFVSVSIVANIFFIGVSFAALARSGGPSESVFAQFWVMVLLNGVAFPLLLLQMLLMAVVIGQAHHKNNPSADWTLHRMKWPTSGPLSKLDSIINARGLRDLIRSSSLLLPMPTMKSDIVDVVYLNWLVPAQRARKLLPEPLELDIKAGMTAVTLVTYKHGHFGPAFLGPLRRFLPSPCQSNWRLYVNPENSNARRDAVYFFKATLSHWPHVLGCRLGSDGLLSHLAQSFRHSREGDVLTSEMRAGSGSAPDLFSKVSCIATKELPENFRQRFESWDEAVSFLVAQNRGLSVLAGQGEVLESRIDIPIAISEIRPASCDEFRSDSLKELTHACDVFSFVVPSVSFRALGEGFVEAQRRGPCGG
jgi:hypothetical protein